MPTLRTPVLARSAPTRILQPRQLPTPSPDSQGTTQGTIVSAAVIGSIVLVAAILLALCVIVKRPRSPRQPKNATGGGLLKRFSRWRSGSNRGDYSDQLQPSLTAQSGISGDNLSRERSASQTADVEMELAQNIANSSQSPAAAANESAVDRHASVRSVMTLPPYSVAARPTEQVLGREGERAGVDVVLEHPETVNEEEERREEEMDSLYQIRRARRQEAADREERRRQRREARVRGDNATLTRLQNESRQRAEAAAEGATMSAQLIAEHQNKNRERRVSAVQYFDVGVARHDGSRVRATSIDSDNRPLLSSAASISGNAGLPDSISLSTHHRGQSATSFQSVSSIGSAVSGDQHNGDFEVISLENRSRSPSISPGEAGPAQAPADLPPNYEHLGWGDAPPYESPIVPHGSVPQLPMLTAVPAIEITAAYSPSEPSSRSPNPQSYNHPS